MTKENNSKPGRPRRAPLKAENLLPVLASLARLVELLVPGLPSEERAAAEAFLAEYKGVARV
jgi:hypothetical protein